MGTPANGDCGGRVVLARRKELRDGLEAERVARVAAARRAERAGLLALRELVVDLGEHAGRRGVEDEVRDAAHEVGEVAAPVRKSKFYGAFVLNRRVVLHAIDATPA